MKECENASFWTHADCPYCGEENILEGDRAQEDVTCEHCNKEFSIGVVM